MKVDAIKSNMNHRRPTRESRRSRYFDQNCFPGYVILIGIGLMSCLWGGVKPVGFAVAHETALIALVLSLWVQPSSLKINLKNPGVASFISVICIFLLNIISHHSPSLGRDMFFMTTDVMIVFLVIVRTPRRCLKTLFSAMCVLGIILAAMHVILIIMMQD